MPVTATMTDSQEVALGVTILDKKGQPLDSLPTGATVTFTSSDTSILTVTPRDDGMNADILSVGKKGTAVVTVDSTGLTPTIPSDTATITVIASAPGSLNLTLGAPSEEP